MKRRVIVCLTVVIILCMSLFARNSWAKYETIPPEILQQYDPGVLSGERPIFATVSNADIWDLREHPDRGGDFVLLKIVAGNLSSVQREIISNWVKDGARVYLNSKESSALISSVFGMGFNDFGHVRMRTGPSRSGGPPFRYSSPYLNGNHPVSTDVNFSLSITGRCYGLSLSNLPKNSTVIVSADPSHTKVLVGAFKYGEGYIYFNTLNDPTGRDRDRFLLNLSQWLIGKKVPGAASTEVFGAISPAVPETEQLKIYDLLTLRNGDNLSGTILNESFTVQTTYATLSFPKDAIKRIVFESEKTEIQIMELRRGDILRGVIKDVVINIDIPSAGKTPIESDKIREINFAKKQTAE